MDVGGFVAVSGEDGKTGENFDQRGKGEFGEECERNAPLLEGRCRDGGGEEGERSSEGCDSAHCVLSALVVVVGRKPTFESEILAGGSKFEGRGGRSRRWDMIEDLRLQR